MASLLEIDRSDFPIDHLGSPFPLWATAGASEDSYVRCEINVSSVFPIPHSGTGRNRP
jgi:hypothetical protein